MRQQPGGPTDQQMQELVQCEVNYHAAMEAGEEVKTRIWELTIKIEFCEWQQYKLLSTIQNCCLAALALSRKSGETAKSTDISRGPQLPKSPPSSPSSSNWAFPADTAQVVLQPTNRQEQTTMP